MPGGFNPNRTDAINNRWQDNRRGFADYSNDGPYGNPRNMRPNLPSGQSAGIVTPPTPQPVSSPSANPYADPGQTISVDPGQLQRLNIRAPMYDAQRSAALSDISGQSDAGLAGAQTSLAQSGGLSAADRMALASQFNRNKIMGRQGALAKFGGMEEQGRFAADKANQLFNAEMLNRNLYETAGSQERALDRQLAADMLDRQLEASGIIADKQADIASQPTMSDKLGNVWEDVKKVMPIAKANEELAKVFKF